MSESRSEQDPREPLQNADFYKSKGDPTRHDMTVDRTNSHISEKVYLFPEAFNELRKELSTFWPNLWNYVQGFMAFDAPKFCYEMDGALDCVTQFDSGNVDGICARYLDKLRMKRGASRLHQDHEYFANKVMEDNVRLARDVHENISPVKSPLMLPAFPTSARPKVLPSEAPSPMNGEDDAGN